MIDLSTMTDDVSVIISKSKSKHKPSILNHAIYIDTETSKHVDRDEKGNVVSCYGWVYLYGLEFAGAYGTGRTPSELIADLERIRDEFGCSSDGTHIVCYIHNLSYDIQYLKDFLIQRYGVFDLLAIAPHKFITFRCDAFEFRCSYKLSNRKLAKWADDLGVTNRKAVGEIDYNEVHYQDELLSNEQYHYLKQDVLTLRDCVVEQMRLFRDNLKSIPLTSTGYVRRSVRRNFRRKLGSVKHFRKTALNVQTYVFAHTEFAGGLTHGNRFYAGKKVSVEEIRKLPGFENVTGIRHRDFASHYPTQQRARLKGFPKYGFSLWYTNHSKEKPLTIDYLLKHAKTHCCLIQIAIKNLKIKEGVTLPYAQVSKFFDGKVSEGWVKPITDNGRILYMPGTSVVILTELDLSILVKDYTFSYEILTVYTSTRGAVPSYLSDTIDTFFRDKSKYKAIVNRYKEQGEKGEKLREAERDLLISKQLLNAIYGCTSTNPVRCDIKMDTNGNWQEEKLTPELIEQKLAAFYGNYNSCMPYQLGVYCTSLARFQLVEVIRDIIGYDHFLYCDTDSAFYLSTPEIEAKFDAYNKAHREAAERNGAFVEVDGVKTYYDSFDLEKEDIKEFKFLHAKAYCFVTTDDELHCTVAGVTDYNEVLKISREQELGNIDNFDSGFKFIACGGSRCIYNEALPHVINENGHRIELAGSAIIEDVTKTLSIEEERTNLFYDTEIDPDVL